jgi:hypothetical protein
MSTLYKETRQREITQITITPDIQSIVISFNDGSRLRLFDDGQSCCEQRYFNCDDDLQYYIGCSLLEITEDEHIEGEDEHGYIKESKFLHVTTSKGTFTVCAYNEHNGYYGGFDLTVEEME